MPNDQRSAVKLLEFASRSLLPVLQNLAARAEALNPLDPLELIEPPMQPERP